MPTLSKPLPAALNPRRFQQHFSEYHHDSYTRRYHVTYGHHSFAISTHLPFTVSLVEGLNGEDLEERDQILPFLRLAQALHSSTGRWPGLDVEWADMCPGALILLDLSLLIEIKAYTSLPELLKDISTRIDSLLQGTKSDFAKAETHYSSVLKGIAAFGEAMTSIQREFDKEPNCVLNTNTKARRLRYVAVLARLASEGTTSTRLTNDLLLWATKQSEALLAHEDSKGAILLSTGRRSALPYLDLARSLAILTPVGKGLALTNSGRVLVLLPSKTDSFLLTIEERLYFLFEIMEHDRDFLLPLLMLLHDNPSQSKLALRREFPTAYKAHLTRLKEKCGTARSRRQIDAALQRIEHWESAERYMEHIVDPRVSWLVDLGLCSLAGNQIAMLPNGKSLAKEISELAKDNLFVITERFLKQWFFKTIAIRTEISDRHVEKKISEAAAIEVLKRCCDFVRDHTTSLARNRVVASTLFRFASIVFFVEHSVTMDFMDLLHFCSNQERMTKLGWRLRWSTAQNDGYLMPITYTG